MSLEDSSDPTLLDLVESVPVETDVSALTPSRRVRGQSYDIIPSRFNSPNLREVARYGGYGVYGGQSNTDPWVRTTLKTFSREIYEQIYGYTRKPQGTPGMYRSLLKFSDDKYPFRGLSREQRQAMQTAIGLARKAFKLPYKSEPLDWHEVGQHFRRDTAAGVSFMGQKKGDVMPEIYHKARWLGHRMKQSGRARFNPTRVQFPPCVAGQRGGMSEASDPKTRLVWVYPAEMLVVEGQYAPVMYRKYMEWEHSPMLNGKSAQRLYTEWTCGLRDGETLYGLDFSGFDTTVPAWLIRVAFSILRQNIEWEYWRGEKVTKRESMKWKNVWDGMVWYFINTVILMPDGRMFRKYRGVPSGSWWTQMVDSVVNWILITYMGLCQAAQIRNLKVLGDDSAFRSGSPICLERGASDLRRVGMKLSTEKCEVTCDPGDFKLLGARYRYTRAYRDTEEWFKLLLYPESAVRDLGVSMSRLVGLWLGGAMWDDTFCRFFEYYQRSFPCPVEGWFSKDQRRWLEVVYSGKAPRGWSNRKSLFWRSIFYTFG
nr:RNA-dependent RNA polymerase [Cordyceps chanhua partitivirus 1]